MSESVETIEYLFGFDGDDAQRRLVLDTESRRARPVDGSIDYAFLKASRRINAMRHEMSAWPDTGKSAS
ncbi:hypothetical protein [Streptomyces sp. CAU 1734]|uniref:hypothetical protein n=1 Tax=Streptomyces sp. CAU 1734 TaxID=3140360 RepID=UPI0032609E0F